MRCPNSLPRRLPLLLRRSDWLRHALLGHHPPSRPRSPPRPLHRYHLHQRHTAASAATTAASTAASATTATCASSAGAKPKYPAPPEETSCLLNEQPQATPRRVQGVAQRIAPVCLVAWPVAAVTWGMGPSLLQFATAHAAGSCDPTSDLARHTYSYAACLISSARPRTCNAHGMRRP